MQRRLFSVITVIEEINEHPTELWNIYGFTVLLRLSIRQWAKHQCQVQFPVVGLKLTNVQSNKAWTLCGTCRLLLLFLMHTEACFYIPFYKFLKRLQDSKVPSVNLTVTLKSNSKN